MPDRARRVVALRWPSVWPAECDPVLTLPDGGRVRGRSLRRDAVDPRCRPDWGLYLTGARPPATAWPQRWLPWRDFWVPSDDRDALDALREAHERSTSERVEVACPGGVGRTGTTLAALLVLEGVAVPDAIRTVRETHHPRAVETPWQRRWLARVVADRPA